MQKCLTNAQNILNFCNENNFKFRSGCFTDAIESQAFLDCNDTQLISVVQSGCVCVWESLYAAFFSCRLRLTLTRHSYEIISELHRLTSCGSWTNACTTTKRLWMNLFGSFLGPVKCPNPVLFPAAIFWCISTIFHAFGREPQNAFIPVGWLLFDTTSLLPCFEAYQFKSDPWLKKANRQIIGK